MAATRILRCEIGLIIFPVAGAFAVPWRMGKPWLTPTGNQRMGITAFALETNGSMFQMMR